MSEAISCKGIILKNHRLSDSDKIIHVITDSHGPIKAVAKGAYKIKSKLGPKTQVLQFCEFLFAKGRNLDIVQEIRLVDQFNESEKPYPLELSTEIFSHYEKNRRIERLYVAPENYQQAKKIIKN